MLVQDKHVTVQTRLTFSCNHGSGAQVSRPSTLALSQAGGKTP
jgi:hypothetical protein